MELAKHKNLCYLYQSKSKEAKIEEARRKVDDAKKTGNAQRILAAESELAALEAEKEVAKAARARLRGAAQEAMKNASKGWRGLD